MKSCVRTTPCFGGGVSGKEFAARGENFQQLLQSMAVIESGRDVGGAWGGWRLYSSPF